MPRLSRHNFTDAFVRNARARGDKRTSYSDAKTPGLELRVDADGRRRFAFRYVDLGGCNVRVTLGRFSESYGLESARKDARAMRVAVDAGADPRAEKRARRASHAAAIANTMGQLFDAWAAVAQRRLRASTLKLNRERFDNHVRPHLGGMPIVDIRRADIQLLVDRLSDRPVTANRVVTMLSSLFRFAQDELEIATRNPARRWRPFRETSRDRVLSDAEIRTFWHAVEDPHFAPRPQTAIALQLCLLLAQRPGEVTGMHDDELNLAERLWTIPPERTKARRELAVPLPDEAILLIRRAQKLRGERLGPVFGLTRMALSQAMRRLCMRVNLKRATPHDLRRTARTALTSERVNVSYEDAERVIGHLVGSAVARVYDRNEFLSAKRKALEAWAKALKRIIAPEAHVEAA